MDKKQFGQRLKELRTERGITQFELAEAVDLHEKHISKIESGIYFPTFDNFAKIMEILDVEWKDFDINTEKTKDPVKNKLLKIIHKSTPKELNLYSNVLEQLQKSLKDW